MNRIRCIVALLVLAAANPGTVDAQAPHREHRTLRTEHFAVHFTPELEVLARRAAVHAERAYARLSEELVPPRGTIELVVSDNADYANGYATVFPSNRVVVYAHPPIDSPALRHNDDWMFLVVAHELVHLFHLDRSRGMWRALQYVFGRNPLLFPNNYAPRWLTEGLATYYETRVTGSGRLAGSFHRELARAQAREAQLPRLDEISVASPVFPGGEGVYVYGSLFLEYLARTRGADKVPALVERTAVHPVPFILNRVSRHALGVTYADAWREFTDSLERSAGEFMAPIPGWRDLTPPALAAEFLRWDAEGMLTYTGAAPRERYGAYAIVPPPGAGPAIVGEARGGTRADGVTGMALRDSLDVDPARRYLGRRNGATPNVRLADGALLYAQPDYVDPYTYRVDLYVERGGDVARLTRGARLSAPDATADDRVVAVQAVPGGSRLVRLALEGSSTLPLSADGGILRPLTAGGPDEYWAEPRWSPDGTRIAAIRWRSGVSSVAILDTMGRIVEEFAHGPSVQSAPSWLPEGDAVLFASERQDASNLYLGRLGTGGEVRLVGSGVGSVFWPELSPDGTQIAAVRLGAGGYRVGTAPFSEFIVAQPFTMPAPPIGPPDSAITTAARPYRPLRQLLPRYWFPLVEGDEHDTRIGFYTSGSDVLQRHGYEAQLAFPVEGHGMYGGFSYAYSGLKRPVLGASFAQYYDLRGNVYSDTTYTTQVGHIDRRARVLSLSATFLRPRVRSNAYLVLGGGAEWRANVVYPDLELDAPEGFLADSLIPRVTAGVGYARVQSAPYAISPEDGFSLSLGATNRWVNGARAQPSQLVTGTIAGYRSLPLPGYARHVAAIRAAGGYTDVRSSTELEVGGVSGGELPIAFGLASIGEGRRTFFVRGFEAGTLRGTRAWAASAEYRAPLRLFARGVGLLPFFVERTSFALFGDAGSAWCPTFVAGLCAPGNPHATIASAGGEARINMTFGSWDQPFQLRAGVAAPVVERDRAPAAATFYITSGLSF